MLHQAPERAGGALAQHPVEATRNIVMAAPAMSAPGRTARCAG
jgi:hypothetical protein